MNIADAISVLWVDLSVQKCFAQEGVSTTLASYYFDNIDGVCAVDYSPTDQETDQDILHSRAKTTITETTLKIDSWVLCRFDKNVPSAKKTRCAL